MQNKFIKYLCLFLEPERKLLLAEKGSNIGGEPCEVTAKDGFIFVGTMNPGGDYGKKELSPALRNRFTEIWCEGCSQRSDLIAVIEHNLTPGLVFKNAQNGTSSVGSALVDFVEWFSATELGNRYGEFVFFQTLDHWKVLFFLNFYILFLLLGW